MARVALCPQCNNELFVADEMNAIDWAKCPSCRAYFQIQDARAREIPGVLPVGEEVSADAGETQSAAETEPAGETAWLPLETTLSDPNATFTDSASQTISDVESTGSHGELGVDPFPTLEGGLIGQREESSADTYVASERSPTTVSNLADFAKWTNSDPSDADGREDDERGDGSSAETTMAQPGPLEITPTQAAVPEPLAPKRLEDSAERIDKWFRTAKTMADAPAAETNVTDALAKREVNQPGAESGPNAEAELPAHSALADAESEIKLEERADSAPKGATWEDPERMERLLADIDGEPASEPTAEQQQESMATPDEQNESGNQWSTEISPTLSMGSGSKPRRKKSAIRSLAMSAAAGVMGLALGYYALFWVAGPNADFLDLAQYLPAAMLPEDFQSVRSELAATAPPTNANVADDSGEIQASFNEPVGSENEAAGVEDRSSEPSQFESQQAAPLNAAEAQAESATVLNAPSFTADELAVSLRAAEKAKADLVAGNLNDSREVAQAKGFGYSLLCDLAQKATFVDRTARADYVAPLDSEAEAIFRQALADEHTRNEVALIVPRWIASRNRKHGGIFFAGTLAAGADKGTVVECTAELGAGTALTVLLPQVHAAQLSASAGPVGIVGWIVDKPTEEVSGYTGQAPQAVFVSRLIPLE